MHLLRVRPERVPGVGQGAGVRPHPQGASHPSRVGSGVVPKGTDARVEMYFQPLDSLNVGLGDIDDVFNSAICMLCNSEMHRQPRTVSNIFHACRSFGGFCQGMCLLLIFLDHPACHGRTPTITLEVHVKDFELRSHVLESTDTTITVDTVIAVSTYSVDEA